MSTNVTKTKRRKNGRPHRAPVIREQGHERCRGCRSRTSRGFDRLLRIHRRRVSQGVPGRLGPADHRGTRTRRGLHHPDVHRRFDRTRTRRRPGRDRRSELPRSVPVRPDHACHDQQGRDGVRRRAPVALGEADEHGLLRQARLRSRRGHGNHLRRRTGAELVGGRQPHLPRQRREDHRRGQLLADRRPLRNARHLLRHADHSAARRDPDQPPRRHRRPKDPSRRSREGGCGHRDRRPRPEHPVQAVGQRLPRHRGAPAGLLRPRGQGRTHAAEPVAPAVGCRQHRQCRPGRAHGLALRAHDQLHRGHPGRHDRPDRRRQDRRRLGHRLLAVTRRGTQDERNRQELPRQDHPAPAGRVEPSRGDQTPVRDRLQRHDRGRHLRQRQLDPRDGHQDDERHRRFGRLLAQRGLLDLRQPVGGQGRQHLGDRPDGQPPRPHRARRDGHHHRAGPGRPARPCAAQARQADHRELRAPQLP